jgi:hypothetical protein
MHAYLPETCTASARPVQQHTRADHKHHNTNTSAARTNATRCWTAQQHCSMLCFAHMPASSKECTKSQHKFLRPCLQLQQTIRMQCHNCSIAQGTTQVKDLQLKMQAAECFDKVVYVCGKPRLSDNMPSTIGQAPRVPRKHNTHVEKCPPRTIGAVQYHEKKSCQAPLLIPKTQEAAACDLAAQLACAQPPKHRCAQNLRYI